MNLIDVFDTDKMSEEEFNLKIEKAWHSCETSTLAAQVNRGKIVKVVRDRYRNKGGVKHSGFVNWLKKCELSAKQAQGLIELADSSDEMGAMQEEAIDRFTSKAFVKAAKCPAEVRAVINAAAADGGSITIDEVSRLEREYIAASSEFLPDEVKEKSDKLPAKLVAPLAVELETLPQQQLTLIQDAIAQSPDIDTIKLATKEAKLVNKFYECAQQLGVIESEELNLDLAVEEAIRVGCLSTTVDLVKKAKALETQVVKLHNTLQSLRQCVDIIYVDTGESNPTLRHLLEKMKNLTGEIVRVRLDDAGTREVNLTLKLLDN